LSLGLGASVLAAFRELRVVHSREPAIDQLAVKLRAVGVEIDQQPAIGTTPVSFGIGFDSDFLAFKLLGRERRRTLAPLSEVVATSRGFGDAFELCWVVLTEGLWSIDTEKPQRIDLTVGKLDFYRVAVDDASDLDGPLQTCRGAGSAVST